MKFLCLHGYGTSGYILEQQLIPIANALGGNHEFVYLDGDVKVDKTGMSKTLITANSALIALHSPLWHVSAAIPSLPDLPRVSPSSPHLYAHRCRS